MARVVEIEKEKTLQSDFLDISRKLEQLEFYKIAMKKLETVGEMVAVSGKGRELWNDGEKQKRAHLLILKQKREAVLSEAMTTAMRFAQRQQADGKKHVILSTVSHCIAASWIEVHVDAFKGLWVQSRSRVAPVDQDLRDKSCLLLGLNVVQQKDVRQINQNVEGEKKKGKEKKDGDESFKQSHGEERMKIRVVKKGMRKKRKMFNLRA